MLVFSYLLLAIGSVFASLLPYRQSAPLTIQSKVAASIISICCLLISLSALIALAASGEGEDSQVLRLIFSNLQLYLALPLIASMIFFTTLGKNYSRGAWGRWSLVLLATFELCRRAEVGDHYSLIIAVLSSFCMAIGLLYNSPFKSVKISTVSMLAIISFSGATLIFSPHLQLTRDFYQVQNLSAYNVLLAISLCLINFCFSKRLSTV